MKKRFLGKGLMKSGGNIPVVATIIVLIAFVAGLLVGSLAVVKSSGSRLSIANPMSGAFADGWNAAKKKLAEFNPMMSNVSSLSGQVESINGQEISFTTSLINPLDSETLKTRIAVVGADTKIAVWKLKSADQLAADQKDGQAQLAKLQAQNSDLNAALSACNQKTMAPAAGESDACQGVRAKQSDLMKAMMDAQQKLDMYQKMDNAGLGDIKAGWNITVMAAALKTKTDEKAPAPVAMMSQYENIAAAKKFTASSIDVREIMSAPVKPGIPPAPVAPSAAAPAPVTPAAPVK